MADPQGLGEPLAASETELLLRQVHPSWIDPSTSLPSSQTFRPTPKDEGMLSVSLSSKTTAQSCFDHHTLTLGLASIGVLAVSTQECAAVELKAYAKPVIGEQPDPAHGVIAMHNLKDSKLKTLGKALSRKALERGWQYPAKKAERSA